MATRTNVLLLSVLAAALFLVACGSDDAATVPESSGGAATTIDSAQGAALIGGDDDVLVIDVRTREEYMDGHLVGAQNIDVEDRELWASRTAALDRDRPTVVYCRSGRRSAIAADELVEMGFTEVYDLGGVEDWDPDELRVE